MPHVTIAKDTPEEFKNIPAGLYTFRIDGAPTLQPARKQPDINNLVVELVVDDGEHSGRKMRDYIFQNEMGQTKTLQLCKSAGIEGAGGFDTDDLAERLIKAVVSTSTYVDDTTKETRESSNISRYVWDK